MARPSPAIWGKWLYRNMLFSQKVEELTRTRNKALLAREAILGDNLKNWRDGRADKEGTKYWGPVIRLANACELNAEQTTELLLLAQQPSFEELQYAKPDDRSSLYAKATREAIKAIQLRSTLTALPSFPNYQQRITPSKYDINEGDIIPRDRFSDEQLIPLLQEAEKRKLKLELKLVYWVTSAIVAALFITTVTLIASPAARATAARIVLPIVETIRQFFEERSSPEPTPTMSPRPVPTATILPSTRLTQTVLPTLTPTPNGMEDVGARETAIAIAVNQTLAAATQTAPVATTPAIATVNSSSGNNATSTWTPIPTPYRCEAKVVSPEGNWPLRIDFRNVPDGVSTNNQNPEFQTGDSVIIQDVSPDGRWYRIRTLDNELLGWAAPYYFVTDCIQTSQ